MKKKVIIDVDVPKGMSIVGMHMKNVDGVDYYYPELKKKEWKPEDGELVYFMFFDQENLCFGVDRLVWADTISARKYFKMGWIVPFNAVSKERLDSLASRLNTLIKIMDND